MSLYEVLHKKLMSDPSFRERRNRGPILAMMACEDLGLKELIETSNITYKHLDNIARRYDSYRHEYDAVQKANKDLQGEDYKDKTKLVQDKLIEFGYEENYYGNIAKLKKFI